MGACCSDPNETPVEHIEEVLNEDVHNMKDVLKLYKFGQTLGSGASCHVSVATNKQDVNDQVAIKIMDKTPTNKRLYQQEIAVLTKLTPDITKPPRGILPFICNGEDSDSYYIVTRLLTGGELFDRILSKDDKYKITEKVAIKLCKDMLQNVKLCHDKGIVHSDLKPENFVFADDSPDSDIVLVDFGSAAIVTDDQNIERVSGTAYYLAPELAAAALDNRRKKGEQVNNNVPPSQPRNGKILKASDVYAMGIIAHVMMTGRAPFYGDDDKAIYEATCTQTLRFPDTDGRYHNRLKLSDLFKDFIRKALVKDPLKRITLSEAINHPWVQGHDAADIAMNELALVYLRQFSFETKLKKEITRVLAANITAEPTKQVLAHFNRLDSNGDGFIDVDGLTILLLDMGYVGHKAKVEAQKMIDSADVNKDDRIDFEEFKQAYYRKVLSTNDQYIHRVFNVFDKTRDGTINSNELKMILFPEKEIAKNESKEEEKVNLIKEYDHQIANPLLKTIQKMINEVDENGDGVIDFKEFKRAMHEDIKAGNLTFGVNASGV